MASLFVSLISKSLGIAERRIKNVVTLLDDGATIPFIARYRKELTDSMDEVAISNIQKENDRLKTITKRKETILSKIEEQGALTPDIRKKIEQCWDENKLEDIYLPFKKKTKTKATVAREQGLEPLAKTIVEQRASNIRQQAKKYLSKAVSTVDDAIQGAQYIIAEWVNENEKTRNFVRSLFKKTAWIEAKEIKKSTGDDKSKFRDYFDFSEPLTRIPSHRLLAILRGEQEGYLKTKVDIDTEEAQYKISDYYVHSDGESAELVREAIADCLKRLLLPSIRNEYLKAAKERADDEAIEVFSKNAKALLLAPALDNKTILGIDPGFRSGCKTVVIDQQGNLLKNTNIYPHPPQSQATQAEEIIYQLAEKYKVEAVAIGNGTAGKETYRMVNKMFKGTAVDVFLINEDGASIYSASAIAREEFPDQDITVRGAVSIARRLLDPLSELVKIDPKSIGVGQYQHDVNQKKLKDNLTETVGFCVNQVGVNVNTGSKHLLSYIAGLGPTLATNIVDYRKENGNFDGITQLKKVPRMGAKAFEQCAGFLRIREGKNPLDNTGVHPESYSIVKQIAKDMNMNVDQLIADPKTLKTISLSKYVSANVGMPTLKDILKELEKTGLDIRGEAKPLSFKEGIESIGDLKSGMIVNGVVVNLTKFGAFVDLGIKESGLIHISQITDRFIKDPSEVLQLNQEVNVKVTEIDLNRKRIGLTMKF